MSPTDAWFGSSSLGLIQQPDREENLVAHKTFEPFVWQCGGVDPGIGQGRGPVASHRLGR